MSNEKIPGTIKALIAIHIFFFLMGLALIGVFLCRDLLNLSAADYVARVLGMMLTFESISFLGIIWIRPKKGKLFLLAEGVWLLLSGIFPLNLAGIGFGILIIILSTRPTVKQYFEGTTAEHKPRKGILAVGVITIGIVSFIAWPFDQIRLAWLEEQEMQKENIVFAIPPEFEEATDFLDGFAYVKKKGQGYLVDQEGTLHSSKNNNAGQPLGEKRRKLFDKETDMVGLTDMDGNIVLKPIYYEILPFSEGLAVALKPLETNGQRYGCALIDPNGNIVLDLETKYEFVSEYYSEGKLGVVCEGKAGYIDRNGEEIIPIQMDYQAVYPFCEGVAVVERRIDQERETLTDAEKNYREDFESEHGRPYAKFGLIDAQGHVVLQEEYTNLGNFHNGRALCGSDVTFRYGTYRPLNGYIDHSGQMIVEPQYQEAENYSDGLALVTVKEDINLRHLTICKEMIDINGDVVLRFSRKFFYAYPSQDNMIRVMTKRNGKFGYIKNPLENERT